MLKHLPCIRIDPAPLTTPQTSRNMEERAIRFKLERQACQSLRQVLKLKLQQRRSREELLNQGIMPPLKSSVAFHEQRRNLERARTEDYLKRKIRSRPERSELIRMHILEETSVEPSLQSKQLQLKRSRLADDLNDRIAQRPGPMELIHKNILPVHSSIKQAIAEAQFPKASGNNSSCDEDSSYSLSPEECPLNLLPLSSPPDTLACSIPSPTQVLPPLPHLQSSSSLLKMTNGTEVTSTHRTSMIAQFKGKPNPDRSAQRHRKPKDNKPKIKKLKYHQYIPPDQKGDKEPPPQLDSSYAKILQQQQHFLQLQILNQQQPHYSYHAILPAPPRAQTEQQPSSSSSSPPQPGCTVNPSAPGSQVCSGAAPAGGTRTTSLPAKLDELKVPELKSELKLRSLPVSGTKNDLIERLRSYQEVNGGSDTTSGSTAGGTAEPGPSAGSNSQTTATINRSSSSQQQLQCQLIESAGGGSSAAQQLLAHRRSVSSSDVSLGAVKSEDTDYCSDNLADMLSLQVCSDTQLPVTIKEEPKCSTQAPCQFSLKAASLQKHCLLSSPASTTTNTLVAATDKDKMLREKDKQIEELTNLLRHKQRLVELLRMQLEHRKAGGRVPESVVLLRVKQEPPDKPSEPPSLHLPESQQAPSVPSETDACDVTMKKNAVEADEAVPETTVQFPDACVSQQTSSQTRELQIKAGQTKQQKLCLQQTALQFTQQQAIQKLLLQQHKNMQNQQQTTKNQGQTPENLQKVSHQKKKKSHKQQLRQQQPERLKQQSLLLLQQTKQQQMKPGQQIQTKMQLMQQQVLIQQKQQAQQQSPQVSQRFLNQQPGPAGSFLKSNSTPALVTDHNGNHFLIALTSHGHVTDNQGQEAPQSKAAKHITLQRLQSTPAKLPGHRPTHPPRDDHQSSQSTHVGLLRQQKAQKPSDVQVCVDQSHQPQQQVSQCLSAPPSLQPFFSDQENGPSGVDSSTPSSQTDAEHQDDFIDMVLHRGETSTTFKPAPASSLDLLNPTSSASSSPTSPPQLLLSASPSSMPSMADTVEEKPRGGDVECGRLEDFLESTTGKPLLGVEPGGGLTLIDDLHSQMLCTPSILDHPPSPMDTLDMAEPGEHGLDGMDWLDLSMGEDFCMRGEETPTLAPLGPHTPPSVFSTDFLDSYDIETHWDSCL